MFHHMLTALREASRWPEQDCFSAELGLSLSGYKKYEKGTRIPSHDVLRRICQTLKLSEEDAEELWRLRDNAKLKQLGLTERPGRPTLPSPDALAKKIESEVAFILKQAGITVPSRLGPVIHKRIGMILKSVLGA